MATVELQPVRPVNVLAGGIVSTRVGASLRCLGAQVNVSVLAPAADGTVVDYLRAPHVLEPPARRLQRACETISNFDVDLRRGCRRERRRRGCSSGGAGANGAARYT